MPLNARFICMLNLVRHPTHLYKTCESVPSKIKKAYKLGDGTIFATFS